jgi:hypothetical protein
MKNIFNYRDKLREELSNKYIMLFLCYNAENIKGYFRE